jgi:hypothetical protein
LHLWTVALPAPHRRRDPPRISRDIPQHPRSDIVYPRKNSPGAAAIPPLTFGRPPGSSTPQCPPSSPAPAVLRRRDHRLRADRRPVGQQHLVPVHSGHRRHRRHLPAPHRRHGPPHPAAALIMPGFPERVVRSCGPLTVFSFELWRSSPAEDVVASAVVMEALLLADLPVAEACQCLAGTPPARHAFMAAATRVRG